MIREMDRSLIKMSSGLLLTVLLIVTGMVSNAQQAKESDVKLVRDDDKRRVDIFMDGKLFSSYQYPGNIEKPFLYPVIAPNGSVITRGFPVEPRKGVVG
jgi:hypothetical protein